MTVLADVGFLSGVFPVGNLYSRSQPLLVYLRLRGTEQSNAGTLYTPPAEQAARGNV